MALKIKKIGEEITNFYNIEFEEDELLSCECTECGAIYENIDEAPDECEECGNTEFINTTRHEGKICAGCGYPFDSWDPCWRDTLSEDNLYCKSCCSEMK